MSVALLVRGAAARVTPGLRWDVWALGALHDGEFCILFTHMTFDLADRSFLGTSRGRWSPISVDAAGSGITDAVHLVRTALVRHRAESAAANAARTGA